MDVCLRPAVAADAKTCGAMIYEAFRDIDERHGLSFVDVPHATHVATLFIAMPEISKLSTRGAGGSDLHLSVSIRYSTQPAGS